MIPKLEDVIKEVENLASQLAAVEERLDSLLDWCGKVDAAVLDHWTLRDAVESRLTALETPP
jgi:hypothetical protein